MKFMKRELIEGAKEAEGLTIIIDVFRAFSLEAYMFAAGVRQTHPIGSMEAAFALKKQHPDWILFGERGGAKVSGCDYGNSPCEMEGADLLGKTVIHSTSAGTQGIVNAVHADEIVTGSLVNADAIAAYIRRRDPDIVTAVAMGKAGLEPADEDRICAEYIESKVLGKPFDMEQARKRLRAAGAHFFDPALPQYQEPDYELCTKFGRFPFVIGVKKTGDLYTGTIVYGTRP
ncbi:MAG: 2-phosphosulfolactate phosphatase [Lachnospira sp.]|nr:2-phosphosulfolactate phosphatase [Lachnospira sp.]